MLVTTGVNLFCVALCKGICKVQRNVTTKEDDVSHVALVRPGVVLLRAPRRRRKLAGVVHAPASFRLIPRTPTWLKPPFMTEFQWLAACV